MAFFYLIIYGLNSTYSTADDANGVVVLGGGPTGTGWATGDQVTITTPQYIDLATQTVTLTYN